MSIDSIIYQCDQRMSSVSPKPATSRRCLLGGGTPDGALSNTSRRVFNYRLNTQATVDRADTTTAARAGATQCFEVRQMIY